MELCRPVGPFGESSVRELIPTREGPVVFEKGTSGVPVGLQAEKIASSGGLV
jgi:hypothetical protein